MPSIVRGNLFVYEISQVHACGKAVTIEYKNLVITEDGDEFQTYKETKKTQVRLVCPVSCLECSNFTNKHHRSFFLQYMELPLEQVKAAHERWVLANSRATTKRNQIKADLKKKQNPINVDDDEDADLSDINKLFAEKKNGPHMLENEFEPVSDEICTYKSDRTGKFTKHWKWKHKLTGHVVKRYPRPNGVGWDSGTLSGYLKALTADQHKAAFQRADLVIKLNTPNQIKVPKGTSSETATNRRRLFHQWVSVSCGSSLQYCFPLSLTY